MTLLYAFLLFLLGLFVGSFLNVLSDRLPRNESVVKGRSHCEYCKKTLAWYDLIPLLSFVQVKGKCRYCHHTLSFYYPIVELVTGLLFASVIFLSNFSLTNVNWKLEITAIYYLFIFSAFIVVFFTDIKYGIIPDKIIFPAIVISFLYLILNSELLLLNLVSALGAFLFFYFLYMITRRRGMGFGDVKLSFLLGLVLGFPGIIVGLYIAFLTGAFAALILIVWRKKRFFGATIPFGPFMVIGTLISLFLGNHILDFLTQVLPSLSFL